MSTEILNIDYHVRLLVHKALNKLPTDTAAAAALGISKRCLQQYKHRYNIGWRCGKYIFLEEPAARKDLPKQPCESVAP